MTNEPLRGCPTCLTKVTETQLGLRDYRWLQDALPGRVAPMDVDAMLERKGRFLVLEFKPQGAPLPMGQRLTLKALVRLGMDVWVVHELKGGKVKVGAMDRNGNVPFSDTVTVARLRANVAEWFRSADEGGD
jgi:hypothetical protein